MPDVVLPVLNEREALPWVLGRMPAGYDPIVVDNGSTDGSAALAAALGARVLREPRPGFGAACFAGLRAARGDVVCFMDCDASLDPRDVPTVIEALAGADLVLGARRDASRSSRAPLGGARREATARRGGTWPLHARLANRALAWELRRRTGARITDLAPMRAARREPLLALGIRDRRFGWPLEMVLRAVAAGWVVAEVEVAYLPRAGRSKVTGTVRGTARAIRDMAAVLR